MVGYTTQLSSAQSVGDGWQIFSFDVTASALKAAFPTAVYARLDIWGARSSGTVRQFSIVKFANVTANPLPTDFSMQGAYFTSDWDVLHGASDLAAGSIFSFKSVAGKGTVLEAASSFTDFGYKAALPLTVGSIYRATIESRTVAAGTDTRSALYLICFNAAGVVVGYPTFWTPSQSVGDGWQATTWNYSADALLAAYPTATYVRLDIWGANSGSVRQFSTINLERIP